MILNDMGNTFTPLMEFEMEESKVMLSKNNIFTNIGLQVVQQLNYYNPRSSKWEPVMEKIGLNIDFYTGIAGGTLITIE